MRHGRKFNHLGRKSAHRKSLLSNMASSLILHKRIRTTVAKAKELRKYIEPLITKSKVDTTHSRRVVFTYLGHNESVKELFSTVANKVAERPGGYTRIIKTGTRLGDNAETCIMELVDFNEIYVKDDRKKRAKGRTRRGGKKTEGLEVKEQVTETPAKKNAEKKETEKSAESKKSDKITETNISDAPESVETKAMEEDNSPKGDDIQDT